MTTNKMTERILNHGVDLLAIFPNSKINDPVKLCKALRRLEHKAHVLCVDYCNGAADDIDKPLDAILAKLETLLGYTRAGVPVFINQDPRGYALKIHDSWVRGYQDKGGTIHRDWGGYGILAPDLTND